MVVSVAPFRLAWHDTLVEKLTEQPHIPEVRSDVDCTLIESTLRLSVGERLRQNDRMATLTMRLRRAFKVISADDKHG
jgi:hypothetical protein